MSGLDIVTKQTISKALGRFQCKYSHEFESFVPRHYKINLSTKHVRPLLKLLSVTFFFFFNSDFLKTSTLGLKLMKKQKYLKYFLELVLRTGKDLRGSLHQWFSENTLRQPPTKDDLLMELNKRLFQLKRKNKPCVP